MPDSQVFDDDWDERPAPVTAVAVRLEEAAVDAVRQLAAPLGLGAADLLRRWVMERLETELAPAAEPEAAAAPPPVKKAVTKKKAAAERATAKNKPEAKTVATRKKT